MVGLRNRVAGTGFSGPSCLRFAEVICFRFLIRNPLSHETIYIDTVFLPARCGHVSAGQAAALRELPFGPTVFLAFTAVGENRSSDRNRNVYPQIADSRLEAKICARQCQVRRCLRDLRAFAGDAQFPMTTMESSFGVLSLRGSVRCFLFLRGSVGDSRCNKCQALPRAVTYIQLLYPPPSPAVAISFPNQNQNTSKGRRL